MTKQAALQRVYKANLSPSACLIICYLIERSNKEGTCFPSVRTISSETNLSRRTVQRCLRVLEGLKYICCEARTAQYGRRTSNLYKVVITEAINDIDYTQEEDTLSILLPGYKDDIDVPEDIISIDSNTIVPERLTTPKVLDPSLDFNISTEKSNTQAVIIPINKNSGSPFKSYNLLRMMYIKVACLKLWILSVNSKVYIGQFFISLFYRTTSNALESHNEDVMEANEDFTICSKPP